jgi:hypothetical protein
LICNTDADVNVEEETDWDRGTRTAAEEPTDH